MDYTAFLAEPIRILGIDESYNGDLTNLASIATLRMGYTGSADDVVSILPYFVFYLFCESKKSSVYAETGEQKQLAEFTVEDIYKAKDAWNLGVSMLQSLCRSKGTKASREYLTNKYWLW